MEDVNENPELPASGETPEATPAAGPMAAPSLGAAAQPGQPPVEGEAVRRAMDSEQHEMNEETPAAAPRPDEEAAPAPAASSKKTREPESWLETVKTVVYALLIALVIRTFLFQPFNIPSGSMEGTLLIGDYLFVEKYAYGYSRHSFPFSFMPFSGRIFGSAPNRGDVVVFKMPNQNSPDYMKDYIKRVIGLPGDRIQVLDGRVYINGKIVPRVQVQDYIETVDGITQHVKQYRETLPNGKSYLTLDRTPTGMLDNTGIYVVPAGHYFMMGDNRDNSDDSRQDVGYVPAEDLVGKAELIFFSIDVDDNWWQFWRWPFEIRYGRMFTVID
ncbi:MAG TPA: signal peptidase I [Rhizomicrobium sp.]|nr:signal peptidase I [Rhizomicrobium sp.]